MGLKHLKEQQKSIKYLCSHIVYIKLFCERDFITISSDPEIKT